MTKANELIAEAEKWIGYLEKKSNKNLNKDNWLKCVKKTPTADIAWVTT